MDGPYEKIRETQMAIIKYLNIFIIIFIFNKNFSFNYINLKKKNFIENKNYYYFKYLYK